MATFETDTDCVSTDIQEVATKGSQSQYVAVETHTYACIERTENVDIFGGAESKLICMRVLRESPLSPAQRIYPSKLIRMRVLRVSVVF